MHHDYKRNKALKGICECFGFSLMEQGKKLQFSKRALRLIKWYVGRMIPKLVYEHTSDWQWCYCPQCHAILDREYMKNCDCCGQRLTWYGARKYGNHLRENAITVEKQGGQNAL